MDAEALELIEGPTGQGLNGEAVGALDVLAEDGEWQRDERDEDNG